ncbi:MAG: hypothetical protein QME51_07585, partial [Planctomycetota bacterium]|nr:hypothetical protein [Planctomycetota bacterium]
MEKPEESEQVLVPPRPDKIGAPPSNLKDIENLFVGLARNKGSDLHLKSGLKPIYRIATALYEIGNRALNKE